MYMLLFTHGSATCPEAQGHCPACSVSLSHERKAPSNVISWIYESSLTVTKKNSGLGLFHLRLSDLMFLKQNSQQTVYFVARG